jgi:hypothetical protein
MGRSVVFWTRLARDSRASPCYTYGYTTVLEV